MAARNGASTSVAILSFSCFSANAVAIDSAKATRPSASFGNTPVFMLVLLSFGPFNCAHISINPASERNGQKFLQEVLEGKRRQASETLRVFAPRHEAKRRLAHCLLRVTKQNGGSRTVCFASRS